MELITIISARQDVITFCKKIFKSNFSISILESFPQNLAFIQGTIILDGDFLTEENINYLESNRLLLKKRILFIVKATNPKRIIDFIEKYANYMIPYPCSLELAENYFLKYKKDNKADYLLKQTDEIQMTKEEEEAVNTFLGITPLISKIRSKIITCARTDTPVLILGESGTGKSMIAKLIYNLSNRRHEEFVEYNSSSLDGEFVDSTLFGNVTGAYTDAQERMGLLKKSHKGVLFLDEVGTLSLVTQAKLLTVLDKGIFYSIGSDEKEEVDVRFICATNDDLKLKIMERTFRKDFYHRIVGNIITIPPLRERKEDISYLAKIFAAKHNVTLSENALKKLEVNYWSGNVRELMKCIERSVQNVKNGIIEVEGIEF